MSNRISNIRITFGTGKTKDGKVISNRTVSTAYKAIYTEIASKFGGYTITNGIGGWYDAKRKVLVEETCQSADIAVINISQVGIQDTINDICSLIKSTLNQDCVLVQLSYGTSEII